MGYRFCPQIADIGGARYWLIDPSADYGVLDGIARHRINIRLMRSTGTICLRLPGSLQDRSRSGDGCYAHTADRGPTDETCAGRAELGRIDKTIRALTYIDDENKRRRTLTQLNRGEDRHKLARAVFHGR